MVKKMPNKKYSDEHLNAFIDNQLDATEQSEILDTPELTTRLNQINLNGLLRHLYLLQSVLLLVGYHTKH